MQHYSSPFENYNRQKKQLKEILFSCFKNETNQTKSEYINIKFPKNIYGNLCIFDLDNNIVGFMIYNNLKVYYDILIESVCFSESIRGKGYFSKVFEWFIQKIKIIEKTNKIGLYLWKENPFNKDNKIEKIYNKFSFKFLSEKKRDNKTYCLLVYS